MKYHEKDEQIRFSLETLILRSIEKEKPNATEQDRKNIVANITRQMLEICRDVDHNIYRNIVLEHFIREDSFEDIHHALKVDNIIYTLHNENTVKALENATKRKNKNFWTFLKENIFCFFSKNKKH